MFTCGFVLLTSFELKAIHIIVLFNMLQFLIYRRSRCYFIHIIYICLLFWFVCFDKTDLCIPVIWKGKIYKYMYNPFRSTYMIIYSDCQHFHQFCNFNLAVVWLQIRRQKTSIQGQTEFLRFTLTLWICVLRFIGIELTRM